MFKKNKRKYENCIKCGKPLSKSEIKKGVSKCENCLGKQAKKTKGILAGIGTVGTVVAGIVIYVATGGRKGKL